MLDRDQDLDTAERWVDDWQSAIDERAAQARALSQRLADLTATARSSDGLVEVTVASSGAITLLHLDERIQSQSAAETSRQILVVIHQAQATLTRLATEATEATEATDETIGLDNETGQAIVAALVSRFANPAESGADHGR